MPKAALLQLLRIIWRFQRLDGAGEAALTAYRRAHVGFVFQFYNLIPGLTVRENVALVTDIAHAPMPVAAAVAQVGLGRAGGSLPAQRSGEEQQRVAIARRSSSGSRCSCATVAAVNNIHPPRLTDGWI